jgi:hypothetical protein
MARPLTSLRDALELVMDAPGARRFVFVHINQAAALLAFLRFENKRGRWRVDNAARLANLVSIDGLLRALSIDLLPHLVADLPSAPALLLLSRYIMALASAAGGTFAQGVTGVCQYFIECADTATLRSSPAHRCSAAPRRCSAASTISGRARSPSPKPTPPPTTTTAAARTSSWRSTST